MENRKKASTFGHIYQHALQVQLRKVGSELRSQRLARRHSIDYVATAVNLRPETLQQIEDGQRDFRLKTFFALCELYNIDVESVSNQGELLHFTLT